MAAAAEPSSRKTVKRQAAFHRVNEEIAELAEQSRLRSIFDDDTPWTFVCECGSLECHAMLRMRLVDYRRTHQEGAFVLKPGHEALDDEILLIGEGYIIAKPR